MKKQENISLQMMFVFVFMNFILALSGSLFSGILDQVATEMGVSISKTGMLTSFYSYGAGIGAPIFLILFRKFDRGILLKVMLFCTIVLTTLLAISTNFSWLIVIRFLMGLCGNAYGVLATANIAALSSIDKVGKNLAVLITGSASALMIGVPLTRALSHILNWRTIFMMLSFGMVMALFYFLFFLPSIGKENKPLDLKSEIALFKEKEVHTHILLSFFIMMGYGAFYMYITPYIVNSFPSIEKYMSLLLVFIGFFCFSGNLVGGMICDKLGYYKSLTIGVGLQIIVSLAILLTNQISIINIGLIFVWMFMGWFIGLQTNTGITIVSRNQSNIMISLNGSAIQLGQAIGASITGLIISNMGISKIILVSIITGIIAFIILRRGDQNKISVG